jgi:hypothetical protein
VEKTRLECLATDMYGLDNAILHCTARGIGLDSTWRNMNEHFAPMTFLVTENENGRMVPSKPSIMCQGLQLITTVATFLSENVRTATLRVFLREVKSAVEARAQTLAGLWKRWKQGEGKGKL